MTVRWSPRRVLSAILSALLLASSGSGIEASDLVISELMAVNDGAVRDEEGDSPDFVEIFNAGETSCDLAGWHLTDDALNLEKWTFPSITLESGDFLVVFCSL